MTHSPSFRPSIFVSSLFSLLLVASCADTPTQRKPYPKNPDSELTLLMRKMYDYYDQVGDSIQIPHYHKHVQAFEELHTAKATVHAKSESALYQAMAAAYLSAVTDLNATQTNRDSSFNIVVDQCMNCHEQLCPGPMVRIKNLYIE